MICHLNSKQQLCLSQTPLTLINHVLHRPIYFWNQGDPRNENVLFSFWTRVPISPSTVSREETLLQASQFLTARLHTITRYAKSTLSPGARSPISTLQNLL